MFPWLPYFSTTLGRFLKNFCGRENGRLKFFYEYLDQKKIQNYKYLFFVFFAGQLVNRWRTTTTVTHRWASTRTTSLLPTHPHNNPVPAFPSLPPPPTSDPSPQTGRWLTQTTARHILSSKTVFSFSIIIMRYGFIPPSRYFCYVNNVFHTHILLL